MSFDENGFLGEQVSELSKKIFADHQELFELCYEINRFAQGVKFEFVPHPENRQEFISTFLFVKCMEGIQAAIILIRLGLDADAQILLRGAFETLLNLVSCVEEKEFSDKYILLNDVRTLEILKEAQKKDKIKGELTDNVKLEMNKEIENLEKRIKEKIPDLKKFSNDFKIENLAKKANLHNPYDLFYILTSDYVHANFNSLHRYIAMNEEGTLLQIDHGPCDINAKDNLTRVAEFYLMSLLEICKLFKVDKEKEIKDFNLRLKKM